MPGVTWGLPEDVRYNSGVSHGVLFLKDGTSAVWNGLTSVEEVVTNADPIPRYLDGRKRYQKPQKRTYRANIRTLFLPDAFAPCIGEVEVVPGVVLADQPRESFDFSYETLVNGTGRVIHLVYNATASQNTVRHISLNQAPSPTEHVLQIEAVPPRTSASWVSAHLIVDSTRMPDYIFKAVEKMLYGSSTSTPTFPTQDDLKDLIGNPLLEPLMEPV